MATATMDHSGPPDAPIEIDTQHSDLVHDAQMDFYGTLLATCSSDRTVKIYKVTDEAQDLVTTLPGHEGPVYQVSWAHPKFGTVLASCSFDGSVRIYRGGRTSSEWTVAHVARNHSSAATSVAFAPTALTLASAGADGKVYVVAAGSVMNDGTAGGETHTTSSSSSSVWQTVATLPDCPLGVNAVCWAPVLAYRDDTRGRLVTAGSDRSIRIWTQQQVATGGQQSWEATTVITEAHQDWVRDVAWSPSLIPDKNRIASCSQDGVVKIWTQETADAEWQAIDLPNRWDGPVWRVSWSVTGHLLAVSAGDNDVSLWKAEIDTVTWSQVGKVPCSASEASEQVPPATLPQPPQQ